MGFLRVEGKFGVSLDTGLEWWKEGKGQTIGDEEVGFVTEPSVSEYAALRDSACESGNGSPRKAMRAGERPAPSFSPASSHS